MKYLTKENLIVWAEKAKEHQDLILKYLQILLLLYLVFSLADLEDYVSSLESEIYDLKSDISSVGSQCSEAQDSCSKLWFR